jgi:exopolyphosphatase/guanosine-5'-triphosphate,3'-diphosphate pyrophosphatase
MAKQVAVMDLGTNTFHLLIANGTAADYKEIIHEHDAVRLGEGGINKGIIQPEAYQRGIASMQKFKADMDQHNVEQARAIATSAVRNAANGKQFIDDVLNRTGIQIELIDGEQEAEYIYKGVKLAGGLDDKTSLIMDIGGGSVEFILGNANGMLWKQSFEIGAARLMDKFHQNDPITVEAIELLNVYLTEQLACLQGIAQKHPVDRLIGSSGAFETFAELIELDKGNTFNVEFKNYTFHQDDLIKVTNNIITSSHQQRKAMKGIIPVRVDMIVVASLITRFILANLRINNVSMSTYSLKEGVLAEMMDV